MASTTPVRIEAVFRCVRCGAELDVGGDGAARCHGCGLEAGSADDVLDFVVDGGSAAEQEHYESLYASAGTPWTGISDLAAQWESLYYPMNRLVRERVGDVRDEVVVLLGNGTAEKELHLLEQSPALLVFSDLSAAAVRAVRERLGEDVPPNLVFAAIDALELPFRDESVDVVYAYAVVHHLPEVPAFLAEAARVLRPGGRAVFLDDAYSPLWQGAKRTVLRPLMAYSHHVHRPSPEDLRFTLSGGFREATLARQIRTLGCDPFFERSGLAHYLVARASERLPPRRAWHAFGHHRGVLSTLIGVDDAIARFDVVRRNQIRLVWGFTKPEVAAATRPLKVALVYNSFGLTGSLERERVLLARALARRGVDVHVYTNVDEQTAEPPDVTVHEFGPRVPAAGRRFVHPAGYARFAAAATRAIRGLRAEYDIVDVAGTTAWEHDVVRVHAVQAAEQRRWPDRGGRRYWLARTRAAIAPVAWPKVGVARAIERLQLRPGRYELVLAATEEVAADLRETRGVDADVLEVVPYPIDLDALAAGEGDAIRRQVGAGPDDAVVVFVGHDFARKGLDDAIAAVAAVEPSPILAVVGGGDATPFREQARRLGVGDRVHFLGTTDRPEDAFAAADVLLLPTHEDVWGNVIVEALARGVPVITTAVAGASVVVRAARAGVVTDGSPGQLRDALALVVGDADLRREMAARGREAAAGYGIDRIADQVLAAYARVLARRRMA